MAYCKSCGRRLDEGSDICLTCGYSMKEISKQTYTEEPENNTRRTAEFVGKVFKCPNCGMEIKSFMAFCPGCGLELNSVEVSAYAKQFADQISAFDYAISNETLEPSKKVNSHVKLWGIMGFLYLSLFLFFAPIVLYILLRIMGILGVPALSDMEKRKKQYIASSVFPNDRGSILAGLMFIKAQVRNLTFEKKTRNSYRWIKIWKNKAGQLFDSAEILFKDDKIANEAYSEIIACEKIVKKSLIFRILISVVISVFVGVSLFYLGMHRVNEGTIIVSEVPGLVIDETTETDESLGIYVYQIKNYVGKNLASIGEKYGDNLVDKYGQAKVKFIIVTENGTFIPYDSDLKKEYMIIEQSVEAGKNITVVHCRNRYGKPEKYLINFQSYDEIVLFVKKVGEDDYTPQYEPILPTYDRHIYHIRDYVGKNAASFGRDMWRSGRIDEYGEADVRLVFNCEDGSYVDVDDIEELKNYVVIGQDIEANTELRIVFDTDIYGNEEQYQIKYQSVEEISLLVKRVGVASK